jgi:hypothetical protein
MARGRDTGWRPLIFWTVEAICEALQWADGFVPEGQHDSSQARSAEASSLCSVAR